MEVDYMDQVNEYHDLLLRKYASGKMTVEKFDRSVQTLLGWMAMAVAMEEEYYV